MDSEVSKSIMRIPSAVSCVYIVFILVLAVSAFLLDIKFEVEDIV
jgi:hypothetical protein